MGCLGRFRQLPQIDDAKISAAIRDGIFKPTAHMRITDMDGITVAEIGQGARSCSPATACSFSTAHASKRYMIKAG